MSAGVGALALWLGLVACGPDLAQPVVDTGAPLRPELVDLAAPRLLRRMSLDLRGVLPTVAELDRVEADPAALSELRDAYLDDPLFEERLVDLFAERWHTRVDVFDIEYYDYHLDPIEEYAFERAVGEEPLRLMARVAVEDRPWHDIVTTDTTVANELLGSLWPLDYPEGETGWQEVHYTDGRPAVGVLATNGLWWRYNTDNSNMNRRRAAAIARLLLCEDFLARPVSFSAQTSDLGDVAQAVRTDPYCLACHSAIDPIAASLFGFWWLSQYNVFEETVYHPEREPLGEQYLQVEAAWFGEPMDGLSEMGVRVANDPRFYRCTAETMAASLWRREIQTTDFARIESLRDDFLAADARLRVLVSGVTDTPEYRAGALVDTSGIGEDEMTRRLLTPEQLDRAVEELTAFSWRYEGFDQLSNDEVGFRILLGGVDGTNTYAPQPDPGLTWAYATKRLAQAAADFAVQRELVLGGDRRLLTGVTAEHQPGDAAFDEELARLHWRLLGERADATWLDEVTTLWEQVAAEEGAVAAWTTVVTVLLRDPLFVST